jgi:hypothetical protein
MLLYVNPGRDYSLASRMHVIAFSHCAPVQFPTSIFLTYAMSPSVRNGARAWRLIATSQGQDKDSEDMAVGSNYVICKDKSYLILKMTYDLALSKIEIQLWQRVESLSSYRRFE